MSEIEAGQKWVGKRFGIEIEVLGYHPASESVWFCEIEKGGVHTHPADLFVRTYEKVEPFFRVGAVYKFAYPATARLRYYVTEIREFSGKKFALAERTDHTRPGEDALIFLSSMENFVEA